MDHLADLGDGASVLGPRPNRLTRWVLPEVLLSDGEVFADLRRTPTAGARNTVGVDGERDAMREQAIAAVVIQGNEHVPKRRWLFGELRRPSSMRSIDRPRRGGVGKAGTLRAKQLVLRLDFETGVERAAIE